MAYGVADDAGFVAAPTDVEGAGAAMFGYFEADPVTSRAMVGGPNFSGDAGLDNQGFTRISTGFSDSPMSPAMPASSTTWRSLFDFQSSPSFWLLAFVLAAVGFLYARVELAGRAGPFSGHAGASV